MTRLRPKYVEKVWGRRDLPSTFACAVDGQRPIGEVWFQAPGRSDPELLIKYLFTSERLSIQVHPDDGAARRAGGRRGKDEAWYILQAAPDAVIGLGLQQEISPAALRRAALDGSIETLIDWRPVAPSDVFYSPAGTIHAIGAGLTLIEIQQSSDVTYRLYDYGRPRALHLDEAVACARPEPFASVSQARTLAEGRAICAAGRAFTVERWTAPLSGTLRADRPVWIVPLRDSGRVGGEALQAATVLLVEGSAELELTRDADLLAAYSGAAAESLFA